ncbi:restriction endonuclease subunit S [Streptomyces anulatus]|uniref:restriction endonuclease subunit S n=1 Tax=Streptomyces anulatus TaxID=1892 RepID=UPI00403E1F4A
MATALVDLRYEVHPGDLIFSRANTPELVGAACLATDTPERLMLSDKTLRLVLDPGLADPRFVNICLASHALRQQIELASSGSSRSMQNISQRAIANLKLKWPSLKDQRYIVDALNSVADSERAAEAAIAKMESVQEGFLSKLLGGGEGLSSTGSSSRYVACGDVMEMSGGLPLGQAQSNSAGRYPIFSSGGLAGRGGRQITGGPAIIIGRVGEGAGSVHFSSESAWVTDNALWVKGIAPGWIPEFIAIYLRWIDLRKYQSQTGQPLVTQGVIKRVLIPHLDLAEQQRIVRIHRSCEEELQASRSCAAKLRTLRNGIADGFFDGKIFPQSGRA